MQPQSSSRGGVVGERSVFVGNLYPEISLADTEELLYELFLQAGPLSKVHLPFDKETGKHKCYGFVEFLHKESVPYAIKLMHGIKLHQRPMNVRPVILPQQESQQEEATPTSATPIIATPPNPFFLALSAQVNNGLTFPPLPPSLDMPPPPPFPMWLPPITSDAVPPGEPIFLPPRPPDENMFSPPPPIDGFFTLPPPPPTGSLFPPPLLPLTPPFIPPPPPPPFLLADTPLPQPPTPPSTFQVPCGGHHQLHQSRLHAQDHPSWMKEGVRERISQYHLKELEHSFKKLREAMAHHPPQLPSLPPNPFLS